MFSDLSRTNAVVQQLYDEALEACANKIEDVSIFFSRTDAVVHQFYYEALEA